MNSAAGLAVAVFLVGVVVAAPRPASAKDAAEDLYGKAAAAMDAGDRATAGERFADFRRRYRNHRLYWQASIMWARCESDPSGAIKRLRRVAKSAPEATRAECELEVAHLLMLEGDLAAADRSYARWLKDHAADERSDSVKYWRGLCLRERGRLDQARAVLEPLYKNGRQDLWRSLAGLMLADIESAGKTPEAAHRRYVVLTKASWAAAVRPQALLKAARTTSNAWKRKQFLRAVDRDYPETEEAVEAKKLLGKPSSLQYGVQVGAFVKESGAVAEQKRFQKEGHRATVVKRRQIGMVLHAVIIGPYETRSAAVAKKRELNRRGHASVFITTY